MKYIEYLPIIALTLALIAFFYISPVKGLEANELSPLEILSIETTEAWVWGDNQACIESYLKFAKAVRDFSFNEEDAHYTCEKYNIPCKIDREAYYRKTRKYYNLYIDYENFLILKETFLKEIKPKQPLYRYGTSAAERLIYEIGRRF